MTNDYKEKLLNYLTGNIEPSSNSDTAYYEVESYYENNDAVSLNFSQFEVKGTLYCKNANGDNNSKILVYGNGTNDNTNWYGFIQIFDSNFKIIKTFKTFSTGTTFGVFEKLNVDEIGQVYGIDYYNNKHRLILLNNLSEKGNLPDYQCVLRNSYYLQGDIANTQITISPGGTISGILSVDKSKQSALYFIGGLDSGNDLLYASSFRINVGIANEWIQYTGGVVYQGQFLDSYVYFDIDDTIYCNYYFEETDINNKHIITRTYNQGTSLSGYTTIVSNLEQYIPNITSVTGLIINENKIYFGISGYSDYGGTYGNQIKAYLYDSGNIREVYERNETLNTYYYGSIIKFTQINNKVFIVGCIANDMVNNIVVGNLYVNLLGEDVDYEQELQDKIYVDNINNEFYFCVSNAFNLYNILVSFYPINGDLNFFTYSTQLICRNGYNGEEKDGVDSLLPTQGLLFDENNNLIFARDLYNNKTYNNRSISVLNVPNTFLNEVSIEKENLLGASNTTLVESSEEITKNVYEDLYINFNNQITMSNQNTSNYIDNITGAIRLNQSSGKVLDYDNAKATKIRVTYDDDTSYITSASNNITNNVCTYSIGIHVPNDKNVQSIEIISNDENTTYQTITNLNLENNKYYIITQDVYVV